MVVEGAGPLRTGDQLIIGATEMGVTNGVVQAANLLKKEGYQVINFHTTGAGGRAMEELIAQEPLRRCSTSPCTRSWRRCLPADSPLAR